MLKGNVHISRNGNETYLHELNDRHLNDIIKRIEAQAAEGYVFMDSQFVIGADALFCLDYYAYTEERDLRIKEAAEKSGVQE